MFVFTGRTDGVGVAFTDAVAPDGGVLDVGRGAGGGLSLVEAALGVPVVGVNQVHGRRVVEVTDVNRTSLAGEPADALVTAVRGIGLTVRVADCLPVLLADPAAGVIGAAHAGRAGLVQGVLPAAVEAMRGFGADRVTAWIGPHICGACYEVPAALCDEVSAVLPMARASTSWGTPSLDLGRAARAQLAALGCRVVEVGGCTRTTPTLHSYRRDAAASGRQAGIVWLSPA